MNGIDILTGFYILAVLIHVSLTNIKPYVTENIGFELENSTSNSFNHLGSDMVSGIVTNLVVVMILGRYIYQ